MYRDLTFMSAISDPLRSAAVERFLPVAEANRAAFDRLAVLAAVVMDVPVALVALMGDGTQHLVGVSAADELLWSTRGVPLPGVLNPLGVLANGPVLVAVMDGPSALVDHLGYGDLGFVSYAAVALCDGGGQMVGTLFAGDRRRRRWRRSDGHAMKVLAESVMSEMALHRDAARQRLLVRAGVALNSKLDPVVGLEELARVVIPELADFASVHVLACPVPPGAMPPLPVVTDRVAVAAIPELGVVPGLCRGLIWRGDGDPITETIRVGKLTRQPYFTPAPPPWSVATGSAATIRAGLRNFILAPVVVDGEVIAVVSFGMCGKRAVWGEDDLGALEAVARYAGVALGHSMAYQRTRQSALTLQHSLLSDPPAVDGLDIVVRYRPAGRDDVGGDWYDVFPLDSAGAIAVVVGDVVGHDIAAAGAMGQLRATLRAVAVDHRASPADIVDRLDRINTQLGITGFATLIYAELEPVGDGRWAMAWAVAGHLQPLLVADGASVLLSQAAGGALIQMPTEARRDAHVNLPVGATLLLYTDGLIERRSIPIGDALTGLTVAAAARAALPVDQFCADLLDDAPTNDDIAMLAIRVRPLRDPRLGVPKPPAGESCVFDDQDG